MNLTPSSNAGMVAVSSQPTPMSVDPQGGGSPLSFEQYRSPLVTAYNGPNYATLRSTNGKFFLLLLFKEKENFNGVKAVLCSTFFD